jgi:hypothetical protein
MASGFAPFKASGRAAVRKFSDLPLLDSAILLQPFAELVTPAAESGELIIPNLLRSPEDGKFASL